MKAKFPILALVCGLGALFTVSALAQEKPNVVFILADNVGWGSFGVYRRNTDLTQGWMFAPDFRIIIEI